MFAKEVDAFRGFVHDVVAHVEEEVVVIPVHVIILYTEVRGKWEGGGKGGGSER